MGNDTDKVYEFWRDSTQRFDYFVTGLIGALVAFIAQSYAPKMIGLNPSTLETLSLGLLLTSFWFAFKRIESGVEAFRLMHQKQWAEYQLTRLNDINNSGQRAQNIQTGGLLSQAEMDQEIKRYRTEFNAAEEVLDKFAKKAQRSYHLRNGFLFSGFLLLLLSKILASYVGAP